MSESRIWVKEAVENSPLFNFEKSSSITFVSDLKSAIAIRKKYDFDPDLIEIKVTVDGGSIAGNVNISGLELGTNPIYFSQPAPPGKFIMSLSYILCLYFAVTVLYIFMLF